MIACVLLRKANLQWSLPKKEWNWIYCVVQWQMSISLPKIAAGETQLDCLGRMLDEWAAKFKRNRSASLEQIVRRACMAPNLSGLHARLLVDPFLDWMCFEQKKESKNWRNGAYEFIIPYPLTSPSTISIFHAEPGCCSEESFSNASPLNDSVKPESILSQSKACFPDSGDLESCWCVPFTGISGQFLKQPRMS